MESASEDQINELESLARRIRGRVVELSHAAGTPHLGSSLSCVDALIAAYHHLNIHPGNAAAADRDRFILSKGHAATTLYAYLASREFFPASILDNYARDGGILAEHPSPGTVPGVEAATGSLGHGLSLGIGMAMAARILKHPYRVIVLMSDGECNEGTVWEAAMFAPAQRLDNLTIVIDFNRWQATGRSEEVMALAPLADKWRSFGWETSEVDGHNMSALCEAFSRKASPDMPKAIIAHTVKGKGVSFMEDDNNWHYRIPTAEEVRAARSELGLS